MRDLTRLKDGPHEDGAKADLARSIEAVGGRARLDSGAFTRIERELSELDRGPVGFGWRIPALVLAGASAALLLVWVARPSQPGTELVAVAPPALRPAGPLPSLHGATLALVSAGRVEVPADVQLTEGTLSVRSDAEPILVRTPSARIEVAAHSVVAITIEGRGVRIAAESGSARVVYFDGRIELVAPPTQATQEVSGAAAELLAAAEPAGHLEAGRAKADRQEHGRPSTSRSTAVSPEKHVAATTAPVAAAVEAQPVAIEATPEPEASVVAAPGPSALGTESAQLADALGRVRAAPSEALQALDEHLARYPRGALRPEAERARIALLLKLGRRAEALSSLDKISSPSAELRVVRAELRAEAGRCEEALGDFGVALTLDDDRFRERALFGRAMCRQRLGDKKRMKEDLERYLVLYPRGSFSDKARAELERIEEQGR